MADILSSGIYDPALAESESKRSGSIGTPDHLSENDRSGGINDGSHSRIEENTKTTPGSSIVSENQELKDQSKTNLPLTNSLQPDGQSLQSFSIQDSRPPSISTTRSSTHFLLNQETPSLPPGQLDHRAIALAETARSRLTADQKAKLDATLKDQLRAKSSLREVMARRRSLNPQSGHLPLITDTLDRGAALRDPGSDFSALHAEISASARLPVVELLLARGADHTEQVGEYGNALQAACAQPNVKISLVRLLLVWGADVNAQDWFYGSALQLALYSGSTELIELLVSYGARLEAEDEQQRREMIVKNPYMGSRKDKKRIVGILSGDKSDGNVPKKEKSGRLDFLTGLPARR